MTERFYTNFELDFDYVLLSYYENGKKRNERVKIKPYLFIPSALDEAEYETFDGKKVHRVDFDSVREAREFVRSYENAPNIQIYGSPLYHYVHIYEHFKDLKFNKDHLKILNHDIETDNVGGYPIEQMANKEINVITLKLFGHKNIFVFGLGEYETKEPELLKLLEDGYKIYYKNCADEKELLRCLMQFWKKIQPDIVTGFNVRLFDIPYILKRLYLHFDEDTVNKSLSPFGKIKKSVVNIFNKDRDIFDIVGVPTMDYIDIYKKFSMGVEESYSLNYLSNKILNASKLDYSEYGSLAKLQQGNWNKYVDYNIIDVIRVEQIDDVVNYMDIAFEIAYETGTNYNDSLTTIRVWDVMIHNYLMDRKRVVPNSSDNRKDRQIAGGYVKDPHVGRHKWVMSFDFKSLYPHLCMTFNISPDTYLGTFKPIVGPMSVDKILDGQLDQYTSTLVEKQVTVTGCGTVFSTKKQGFVPAIMEHLFKLRAEHQKKEDHYTKLAVESNDKEAEKLATIFGNKSYAVKILLNSGYGALSNEFYRFFHNLIAESFTLSGQASIRTVEIAINRGLNKYMNTDNVDYICAIDTDSVYINLSDVVEKKCTEDPVDFLEKFSDTVQGWIQEGLEELYKRTNAFKKKLFMSLESIGPAIWIAKKRYVMSLPSYKKVRYNPPKIKIMGIEAVRSSTPLIARNWIKEAIPLALEGRQDDLKRFIDAKWDQFIKSSFADIAQPKGTNDLEKYSDKNKIYGAKTPMHVRGALLFNNYVKNMGLENDIELIKSGDKVKSVYLKLPNPLMENAISIPEELPNELKFFTEYIDYEKQFNKTFLDALSRLTGAAGINLSSDIDMDQFLV